MRFTKKQRADIQESIRYAVVDLNSILGSDDPLDGDETEAIGELFTAEMDKYHGNITGEEYEKKIKRNI